MVAYTGQLQSRNYSVAVLCSGRRTYFIGLPGREITERYRGHGCHIGVLWFCLRRVWQTPAADRQNGGRGDLRHLYSFCVGALRLAAGRGGGIDHQIL
ncbi:hypothetical protein D3C87_1785430 [compost metagenome]